LIFEQYQKRTVRQPYDAWMSTDRSNTDLSEAVEVALAMVDQHGVRAAAAYLADHGAGFSLTCRVLAEPARRRVTTKPVPEAPEPADLLPSA
jgi:hypothetical protein